MSQPRYLFPHDDAKVRRVDTPQPPPPRQGSTEPKPKPPARGRRSHGLGPVPKI